MENLTSWPWAWNGSSNVSISHHPCELRDVPGSLHAEGTAPCFTPSCACGGLSRLNGSQGPVVLLPPSSTSDIPILTPAEGASVILGRRGNMQLGPEAGTMRLEREDVISADIFDDMIHFVETKRMEPYCLPGYTSVPEQTSSLSASAPRILLLTGMDCSCAIHCCPTPGDESRNSMLLSRAASPKLEARILTFDTQGADDPPMSPSVLLEATGDDEGCGVSVATLAMLRSEQEQEKLLTSVAVQLAPLPTVRKVGMISHQNCGSEPQLSLSMDLTQLHLPRALPAIHLRLSSVGVSLAIQHIRVHLPTSVTWKASICSHFSHLNPLSRRNLRRQRDFQPQKVQIRAMEKVRIHAVAFRFRQETLNHAQRSGTMSHEHLSLHRCMHKGLRTTCTLIHGGTSPQRTAHSISQTFQKAARHTAGRSATGIAEAAPPTPKRDSTALQIAPESAPT